MGNFGSNTKYFPGVDVDVCISLTFLQLFKLFFPEVFIKGFFIPQTNNKMM